MKYTTNKDIKGMSGCAARHTAKNNRGKILSLAVMSVLAAFLLCACNNNDNDDIEQGNSELNERYSVVGQEVDGASNPTMCYDISFLQNGNLEIQTACWLDDTSLLLITAKPAVYETDGEGNKPRESEIYIFHTGDGSLTRCFAGDLALGKVKLLNSGEVCIVAAPTVTFFDPVKGNVSGTLDIEDASEMDIAPSGEQIAYVNYDGKICIANRSGDVIKTCTADALGYNWFSTVSWSADSKTLAAFVSYEPYLNDNIAVLNAESGEGLVLDYEGEGDIYPYWPKAGSDILVLRNFFWCDPEMEASIDVVEEGKTQANRNYKMVRSDELLSILYADVNKGMFAFVYDGGLYLADHNKVHLVGTDELLLYEDNAFVSPGLKRAAGINYKQMKLYIMSL